MLPGATGYLSRAFARAVIIFRSGSDAYTEDFTRTLNGGDILVFFLVSDSTLAQLLKSNPDNLLDRRPIAFFSLDPLNPDAFDHFIGFENTIAVPTYTQFAFEDLTAGGDLDWDDVVYNILPPLDPATGELTLSPTTASLILSDTHTLTATARQLGGDPIPDLPVSFIVTGANATSGNDVTDLNGKAFFSYAGVNQGTDFIVSTALFGDQVRRSNTVVASWAPCATGDDCAEVPWPMLGRDAQHTGQSPFAGPMSSTLAWHYPPARSRMVVIGPDDTVYTLGTVSLQTGLHALNTDGSIKWIYNPSPERFSPSDAAAVGPDGTIYVTGQSSEYSFPWLTSG